jgi:dihydrofolate reductase
VAGDRQDRLLHDARDGLAGRTSIERTFDPGAIREMKALAEGDISVSGPTLAAEAFKGELVDECHLFVAPVIVGAGSRALPTDVRLQLRLLDERRLRSGFVFLSYRTDTSPPPGRRTI